MAPFNPGCRDASGPRKKRDDMAKKGDDTEETGSPLPRVNASANAGPVGSIPLLPALAVLGTPAGDELRCSRHGQRSRLSSPWRAARSLAICLDSARYSLVSFS